jgi:hypothetical protein
VLNIVRGQGVDLRENAVYQEKGPSLLPMVPFNSQEIFDHSGGPALLPMSSFDISSEGINCSEVFHSKNQKPSGHSSLTKGEVRRGQLKKEAEHSPSFKRVSKYAQNESLESNLLKFSHGDQPSGHMPPSDSAQLESFYRESDAIARLARQLVSSSDEEVCVHFVSFL